MVLHITIIATHFITIIVVANRRYIELQPRLVHNRWDPEAEDRMSEL